MSKKSKGAAKVSGNAVTRPISLYPDQISFVDRRADSAGNFSRYIQLLVEYDREHNILPQALVLSLTKEKKA